MGDRQRGKGETRGARGEGAKAPDGGEKRGRGDGSSGRGKAVGEGAETGQAKEGSKGSGGRGRKPAARANRGDVEGGSQWRISTVLLVLLFILLYAMWAGSPDEGVRDRGGGGGGVGTGGRGAVEPRAMVLIDAGHGGRDGGTVGNGMVEKEKVLVMAKELRAELQLLGITSELTREDDRYLELEERWGLANRGEFELIVSLHLNGSTNPGIHGVETFFSQPKSPEAESLGKRRYGEVGQAAERGRVLAQRVQELMVQETGARDRGAKNSKLAVVYRSACPAILVEAGFLTHGREATALAKAAYRKAIVRAIARAIDEWKRGEVPPPGGEGQDDGEPDAPGVPGC